MSLHDHMTRDIKDAEQCHGCAVTRLRMAERRIAELEAENRDLRVAHEVVTKQTDLIFARATAQFALETAGKR